MSLGALTWTCLVLSAAAGPPPADEQPMNQRAFQIPIHFDPQKRSEIQYLQLFVSRDKGKTWTLAQNAKPDQDNFDYAAAEDGSYWFTMVIIDPQGRPDPPNIFKAPGAIQKLLVDTTKPDIRLTAERHGDAVQVTWNVYDANPRENTLKLEYRESPEGPWTPVPIKAGWSGQAEFQDTLAVTVRMELRDVANNLGQDIKQVPAANGGPTLPSPAPTPVAGPAPLDGPPPPLPAPLGPPPALGKSADRVTEAMHSPVPPLPEPPESTPAPPPPTPLAVASKTGDNTVVAYTPPAAPTPPLIPPPAVPDLPAATPHPETPALQIVNKRQVKLEFDVGKFGPSGLGGVDVYVTTDDGATWTKTQPEGGGFLPAAAGAGGAVRGSVTVSLANEAVVYGYYLVVKSKAGLGKAAPHAGDLPQIRLELDTLAPKAALYMPKADPARRDTLVLTWDASDRNLTANPITLEWSAQTGPAAQWNLIGPGEMANNGSYAWQPAPDVPPSVYLRLTVRDLAGNRSVAETKDPVLIDLSIPEVTNIGVGGTNPGQH